MRQNIHFRSTPSPRFRYTPCVRTGSFYEFAGMIGMDHEGKLAAGGIQAETRQILNNLQLALDEIDLKMSDMISANIFTTRFDQFGLINQVWEEFIQPESAPARTSIGVSALPLNALVEISFRFYRA